MNVIRALILVSAVAALTWIALWVAGAPVQSNDCWVLPQYADNSGQTEAQDQVVVRCVVEK